MSTRLLAVGDNVVDRYVELGFMYPGGNAVNVAVHARRVGRRRHTSGCLGTDAAGEAVLQALRAEGVDTSLTRIVNGPNASADVYVQDGNRVFGQGRPGVSRFTLSPEDLVAAGRYDVVHTGECSHMEAQLPTLATAARQLSFDFSERPWDYVASTPPTSTSPSRRARAATAMTPSPGRRSSRSLGPRTVAVTLGAAGAVLLDRDGLVYSPAGDVRVVDTLGAGDAFIARLLHGLINHEPPRQLLPAATAYASAACASYGAFGYRTALSTTDDQQALSGTNARWESS